MDLAALLKTVSGEKAKMEAKSGKNNAVKPPPGKSRWRILPGWRPKEEHIFWHDFGQHWIKDADGTVVAVVVSEAETFGREDPVADAIDNAVRAATDDKLIKTIKEMKGRRVVLVNAVRIDGGDANPEQAKLLALPTTAFESFIRIWQERMNDDINILDPETGRDIVIERSGSGFDTKYSITDAAKASKVHPAALASLINIDLWIEAERNRGLSKVGLVAPLLRNLLSGTSSAAAPIAGPSITGALVPARRPAPIIEPDEPLLGDTTAGFKPVVKLGSTSRAAAAAEAELVAAALPDSPLNDDDIEKLLAGL